MPPPLSPATGLPLSAGQAMLTPQFLAIALTHFACRAAHSGPLFHMVSYATLCGLPPLLAVSVFSLAGLSGLGGRIGLGLIADRIGAKPTLVAGLIVQALAVGTYLFVGALGEFYALSVVFGLAYGASCHSMPYSCATRSVRASWGPYSGRSRRIPTLLAVSPTTPLEATPGSISAHGLSVLVAVAIALTFHPAPPNPRLAVKPA